MEENVKIYAYHYLTVLDKLSCVLWAKENYDRFDGNTSFMWNEVILSEFARIKQERFEHWKEQQRVMRAANDLASFNSEIETIGKQFDLHIPLPLTFDANDVEVEYYDGQKEETKVHNRA